MIYKFNTHASRPRRETLHFGPVNKKTYLSVNNNSAFFILFVGYGNRSGQTHHTRSLISYFQSDIFGNKQTSTRKEIFSKNHHDPNKWTRRRRRDENNGGCGVSVLLRPTGKRGRLTNIPPLVVW